MDDERRYPGDKKSIRDSGMATMAADQMPLEHYSPDDLLDMLKDAGNTVLCAAKRHADIQNALQNKLERISVEFMKTQEHHHARMNGEPTEGPMEPRRY